MACIGTTLPLPLHYKVSGELIFFVPVKGVHILYADEIEFDVFSER